MYSSHLAPLRQDIRALVELAIGLVNDLRDTHIAAIHDNLWGDESNAEEELAQRAAHETHRAIVTINQRIGATLYALEEEQ